MASRKAARLAKGELGKLLSGTQWLRGIGLVSEGEDYHVKVNVDALTPEVRAAIPDHCDEVKVFVEEVGTLRAQDPES